VGQCKHSSTLAHLLYLLPLAARQRRRWCCCAPRTTTSPSCGYDAKVLPTPCACGGGPFRQRCSTESLQRGRCNTHQFLAQPQCHSARAGRVPADQHAHGADQPGAAHERADVARGAAPGVPLRHAGPQAPEARPARRPCPSRVRCRAKWCVIRRPAQLPKLSFLSHGNLQSM